MNQKNHEGFRCYQCGNLYQTMFGDTCNGCRKSNKQHQELVQAIKKLAQKS